jgi:transposase
MVGQKRVLAGASYPSGTQRLEKDRFPWPETEEEAREISAEELSMLLTGIDFFKAHKTLYFKKVS